MADPNDFQSASANRYNFSKGPKSLYYGLGDPALAGVVLNVPQTDQDDEWGGTERIAMERLTDYVSSLIADMTDPAGGGVNGVKTRLENVIGNTIKNISFSYPFIDMSTPSLRMQDITVNGGNNSITIGTATILANNSLTFGGPTNPFTLSSPVPDSWNLSFYTNSVKLIHTTLEDYVRIVGGNTNYDFKSTGFIADVITANIINVTSMAATSYSFKNLTVVDKTSDIGSTGDGQVNNIYARNIHLDYSPVTLNISNTGLVYGGATAQFNSAVTINSGTLTIQGTSGRIESTDTFSISAGPTGNMGFSLFGSTTSINGSTSVSLYSSSVSISGGALLVTAPSSFASTVAYADTVHFTSFANVTVDSIVDFNGAVRVGSALTPKTIGNLDIGDSVNYFGNVYTKNVMLEGTASAITSVSNLNITSLTALYFTAPSITAGASGNMTLNSGTASNIGSSGALNLTGDTVTITATNPSGFTPPLNIYSLITYMSGELNCQGRFTCSSGANSLTFNPVTGGNLTLNTAGILTLNEAGINITTGGITANIDQLHLNAVSTVNMTTSGGSIQLYATTGNVSLSASNITLSAGGEVSVGGLLKLYFDIYPNSNNSISIGNSVAGFQFLYMCNGAGTVYKLQWNGSSFVAV